MVELLDTFDALLTVVETWEVVSSVVVSSVAVSSVLGKSACSVVLSTVSFILVVFSFGICCVSNLDIVVCYIFINSITIAKC